MPSHEQCIRTFAGAGACGRCPHAVGDSGQLSRRGLAESRAILCPHNKFWPILAALWPEHPQPERSDYAARCQWLLARGLGLWDVYDSCLREGSLDSAIRLPQVNDFATLKARCPQLQAVAHNGGESYKHAGKLQGLGLAVYKLPSTSPANASWSFERKLAAWRAVMQAVGLLEKED